MSDHERLEGVSDYARCPRCGNVLMSDGDTFACIADTTHGPFRLYYEVVEQ